MSTLSMPEMLTQLCSRGRPRPRRSRAARRARWRFRARSPAPGRCRCRRCPRRGRSAPAPARARPAVCPARRLRPRGSLAGSAARQGMPPRPACPCARSRARPPGVYSSALWTRLPSASRSSTASPGTCASASSKPRSMSLASARCTHSSAASSTSGAQVRPMRTNPARKPPGSARASASSWLARRAVRIVARCTCSSCARISSGTPLRERDFRMRLQAGERRAQLVRRVGEEALLVAARIGHLPEQLVQRAHQRARLLGRLRRDRSGAGRAPSARGFPPTGPPAAPGRA